MLNSAPNRWTLHSLREHMESGPQTSVAGGMLWEPSRPYGYFSLPSRVKLAWAVFTGKADALFWPNQSPPKAY